MKRLKIFTQLLQSIAHSIIKANNLVTSASMLKVVSEIPDKLI